MESTNTKEAIGQPENKEEDKKQSRKRYDHLRHIEQKMQVVQRAILEGQSDAQEGYEKMSFEEKNNGKYLTTFPYPYMNGYLHLGHAFSMSKCEYQVRYQKQQGKNVLFPFSFHCTGMPIHAAARRLRRELESGNTRRADPSKPPTQFEILLQIGISEQEIPRFSDPHHWLEFFPPKGQQDLQEFGVFVDWRRSFITTDVNPYYDSFIRWQFNTLKAAEKVKFGKRYTIYSALDGQPCADHDRSKGEGVGAQEYTLIKIECLELPESMKEQFTGKKVYLVAATLRPETMYGQTNCYVLPEGEYGVFEMINNEYFVCAPRSAKNLAYQEMTKEHGKSPCLHTVKGFELIGLPLKAPLSTYDVVYALPMQTILMTKGTGIVTSVPSDSPDDWAALRDLQTKQGFREDQPKKRYLVKEEWCMPFAPVPIIEIPEFGNLSAVKIVDDLKIQSQKDKDKLTEAKEKIYLKGFYEGVMLTGMGSGMKVQEAKPIIKKHLMDNGMACPYYEPENEVISRTEDECIVALCDQWFLNYGEENWKNYIMTHVKSTSFNGYHEKTQKEFEETIDWLNQWACSRTAGLGTKLPWDTQFLIESLSDSTIYMAYYTVSHLLQGGGDNLTGRQTGPIGIKAEDMNDAVWEYVFKRGAYPADSKIPEELMQKLRYEFEYWYPMDLRCSGKDLIRNHLTMSLYNHAAVWDNDSKMMPRGFFCNGYVLVNGEKMSKSKGNFMTIRDCIEKYGVDATRVAIADAGDTLDDANFDELVANSAILKLFVFERWIFEELRKVVPEGGLDFSKQPEMDLWDELFSNEINYSIESTTRDYDEIKYKQALKHCFFEPMTIKEDYLIGKGAKGANPFLLIRFIETQLILLNPIIPHFSEYCWEMHVRPVLEKSTNLSKKPSERLINQGWPQVDKPFNNIKRRIYEYVKYVKRNVSLAQEKAKNGGKKPAKAVKGQEAPKPPTINSCAVYVAADYPEWQKQVLEVLNSFEWDINNKIVGTAYIAAIKEKVKNPNAMKFAAFVVKEATVSGKESALELKAPFDEIEILEANKDFIFENQQGLQEYLFLSAAPSDSDDPKGPVKTQKEAAQPSKPSIYFY